MRERQRVRYEVDPFNRLVAVESGVKTTTRAFRRVIDGKFSLNAGHDLIYQIISPANQHQAQPRQIRLRGTWSLNKNHDLVFTLVERSRQSGEKLTIQSDIIAADGNQLTLSVAAGEPDGPQRLYLLTFRGIWQADRKNRLIFLVNRAEGHTDRLLFSAAWDIDRQHQLIYEYSQRRLRRSETQLQRLTVKGSWRIAENQRLVYAFSHRQPEELSFRAAVQQFERNAIQYEIGIGIEQNQPAIRRRLIFTGKWRIVSGVGIVFELRQPTTAARQFVFSGQMRLGAAGTVDISLFSGRRAIESVTLTFTPRMLGRDGQALVRFMRDTKQKSVTVGAAVAW